MKLLSLVIAVTLACSGCFTRAQRHEIVTTRSYARSFEQTWHAVVRFFAERNLPIRTIDRSSGIIYSEPLDFPADWLDWGLPAGHDREPAGPLQRLHQHRPHQQSRQGPRHRHLQRHPSFGWRRHQRIPPPPDLLLDRNLRAPAARLPGPLSVFPRSHSPSRLGQEGEAIVRHSLVEAEPATSWAARRSARVRMRQALLGPWWGWSSSARSNMRSASSYSDSAW